MNEKYCCLCGTQIEKFLPWEGDKEFVFLDQLKCIGSDTKNFYCPQCRATDRDRHLWLFLNKLGIYEAIDSNTKIMHIAPEHPLINRLLNKSKQVIAGDLYPEKYRNSTFEVKKIDLTSISQDDNSIDIFIANHILEHIIDYKKALSEINRILRMNGIAILQTPFSPEIYKNFEDPLIKTDEGRDKYYGQSNHVRLFGKQLFDDIYEAGFSSYFIEHETVLNEYDPEKYGVNPNEGLILAIKQK